MKISKKKKIIVLLSFCFSIFLHIYIIFFINFTPIGLSLKKSVDNPIMLVDINVENPVSEKNNNKEKIVDNKEEKKLSEKNIEIDRTKQKINNNEDKKDDQKNIQKNENKSDTVKKNPEITGVTQSDNNQISSPDHLGNKNKKLFLPFYKVDKLPQFIKKGKLEYPEEALNANIEGVVILDVYLNEKGEVVYIKVVSSPGFGMDKSAIKMIKESIFSPALVNGKPVPVIMRFTIKFNLE